MLIIVIFVAKKKKLTREDKQGRHARDWLVWKILVDPEAKELPLVVWKLTPR